MDNYSQMLEIDAKQNFFLLNWSTLAADNKKLRCPLLKLYMNDLIPILGGNNKIVERFRDLRS